MRTFPKIIFLVYLFAFASCKSTPTQTSSRVFELREESQFETLPRDARAVRVSADQIGYDGELIKKLANYPAIESLDLKNCNGLCPFSSTSAAEYWERKVRGRHGVDADVIRVLSPLTSLRSLSLNATLIGDAEVELVAKQFSELEELDLTNVPVTDAGVASLQRLRKLKKLTLGVCRISGSGLKALSSLAHLEELNLDWCTNLKDDNLGVLAQFAALRTLSLSYCESLTVQSMPTIASLEQIRSLNLFGIKWVDDDSIHFIARLENLLALDIGAVGLLSDRGLPFLKSLTRLESLGLQANRFVSLDGLRELSSLPLEELNVYFSNRPDVTDADVKALADKSWPHAKIKLPGGAEYWVK